MGRAYAEDIKRNDGIMYAYKKKFISTKFKGIASDGVDFLRDMNMI